MPDDTPKYQHAITDLITGSDVGLYVQLALVERMEAIEKTLVRLAEALEKWLDAPVDDNAGRVVPDRKEEPTDAAR